MFDLPAAGGKFAEQLQKGMVHSMAKIAGPVPSPGAGWPKNDTAVFSYP